MYAINGWAAWGFYNADMANPTRPSDCYIACKLRLYNCIGSLFAGRIRKNLLPTMKTELYDTLIEHSALFPQSECTHTLHELVHCCDQIEELGPPRVNSLFMFERVNQYLKRMVKNKSSHMSSIVKAYAKEEFITQTIGYKFDRLITIIDILTCMPTNYNMVKKIISSFSNLYVDENNVMYSLPNSRVHELRGTFVKVTLTDGDNNLLTMALASLCRDNSVLGIYNIFTPHLHLYLLCIYT